MTRMKTHERLLRNLRQDIPRLHMGYMAKDEAYELLKQITLQDFGYDVQEWEQWFADRPLDEAMPGKFKVQTDEERHISRIKRTDDAFLIDVLKEHPKFADLIDIWRVTKDEALDELKRRTGQDFGFDADAWEQWLNANPEN